MGQYCSMSSLNTWTTGQCALSAGLCIIPDGEGEEDTPIETLEGRAVIQMDLSRLEKREPHENQEQMERPEPRAQ